MNTKCQCCGRDNGELYVASSSLGAVSFGFCKDCMIAGAEPLGLLEQVYEMCDGEVAQWMLNIPFWNTKTLQYEKFITRT